MAEILVIAGSLRRESYTRALASALSALAPEGLRLRCYPLSDLPNYNMDLDGECAPAAVVDLRLAISAADGLVIATPEYNRSIPGILKNVIDWGSFPIGKHALQGKPIATMACSPGPQGGIRALGELRRILTLLGNYDVPGPEIAIPRVDTRLSVDMHGRPILTDEVTASAVVKLLKALQYSIHNRLADQHRLAALHADDN